MIVRRFAVAPMLDCTDRHCRYFLRLISRHTLLYTEMIHVNAILNSRNEHLLAYHPDEHPLALQLGGASPEALAACARIAYEYGYDEINLNCGCPSSRVRDGRFGACLLLEPDWVARCVNSLCEATPLPVTVKTRLGVDHQDDYNTLRKFVAVVSAAGCRTFIIHARKAWLHGLSPKKNRQVPPLDYNRVYRLKDDFPDLEIIINGGIENLEQAATHLQQVDGVMLGRRIYHEPYLLADVDRRFYGFQNTPPTRLEILHALEPYIETQMSAGVQFKQIARHLLGLFQACSGARHWRRYLSEQAHLPHAGPEILRAASQLVDPHPVDEQSLL